MEPTLRILLILGSICVFLYTIKKIKQSKLKIEDSVIWILGSIILILSSIFVGTINFISNKLGFMAPSNFVFTMIILFLLMVNFSYSIKFSILNEKIKDLNHYIALKEYEYKNNKQEKGEK